MSSTHTVTLARAEAGSFARDVADEGYTAMVCIVTTMYQPDEQPREVVAAPGINFPATLTARSWAQ